jgi:hypothetical protein
LLTRLVVRPSYKPVVWYKSFLYQAASSKTARRVVAKVEFQCGELSPRVGFIVTNLETDRRAVDQGGQAGGEDAPAELPPVPVQRSAPLAERDDLQLGESAATAGAAEADREPVADQLVD